MNISKKFIICASIIFVTILSLFIFHTVPMSQLWKGYRVVYVKSEKLSPQNVVTLLEKNGCADVVAASSQSIPVFSKIAPVQVQNENSYIYRRNAFFTDASAAYSVYYVPDRYSSAIEASVSELNGYAETSAATDGSSSFPWLCPVFALLLFAVLLYYSKSKINFALSVIFLLGLSYSRPFYSIAGSVCLYMTASFFACRLYGRKGFITDLRNAVYLIPLMVLPVFVLVFADFPAAFVYVLCAASGYCAIKLFEKARIRLVPEKENDFKFVYIKKSSSVKAVSASGFKFLLIIPAFIVLMLGCSILFSSAGTAVISDERPSLPGPVSSIKNESAVLPDLQDFMDWSWITMSFPYRKLGKAPVEGTDLYGETVLIPDYFMDSDHISRKNTKVLTYDSSFVSSIYDKVSDVDYPALEKMMMKQGKNSHYAYTNNAGTSSEKGTVPVLLFFAFIPLALSLYYLSGKFRNGFSL